MALTPSTFRQRASASRAYLETACAPIDDSRITQIRDSMSAGRLVVFAASGVSTFKPSCMPSGRVFSSALLSVLESAASAPRSATIHEFLGRVPFEVILHFGRIAVGRERLLRLLIGFYSARPSNPVHRALAEMLATGSASAIVTPNYDTLIEDALRERVSSATVRDALRSSSVRRVTEPEDTNGQAQRVLFKIHGSVDVATDGGEPITFELPQESLLPNWKRDVLATLIAGRDVLFVGYGGWDFDILPVLTGMPVARVWWNCYHDPRTRPEEMPDEACIFIVSSGGSVLFGDLRRLLGVALDDGQGDCGPSLGVQDRIAAAFSRRELRLWYGTLLARVGFGAAALEVLRDLDGWDELARRAERERGHASFHAGLYRSAHRHYARAARELARRAGVTSDVVNIWTESIEALIQQWRWIGASRLLGKSFIWLRRAEEVTDEVQHRRGLLYRLLAKHPLLVVPGWRRFFNEEGGRLLNATEPIAAAMAARSLLHNGAAPVFRTLVDFGDVRVRFARLGHAIAEINGYRDEARSLYRSGRDSGNKETLDGARAAISESLRLATERADRAGVAKGLEILGGIAEAQRDFAGGADQFSKSRKAFRRLEDGALLSASRWTRLFYRELSCRLRSLGSQSVRARAR